jgi:hypothetical protein
VFVEVRQFPAAIAARAAPAKPCHLHIRQYRHRQPGQPADSSAHAAIRAQHR